MNLLFLEDVQKVLIVAIILVIVISVSRRNLTSLINQFLFQSMLLSALIFVVYTEKNNLVLLGVGILTFVGKGLFIPYFLKRTRKSMNVYVDLEYNLFTPTASVFMSLILWGIIFFSFSPLREPLQLAPFEYIGAATGMSLVFIGMLILIGRKKILTKIIGYLLMDNGVVMISIFIGDLPFLIEALILMDLLMLLAISSVLGFGMSSSVEEFHAKLNPFRKWFKKVNEE